MENEQRPAISREGLIFGWFLYWVTIIGTLVAVGGMAFGIVTENNSASPSAWISSIWDGRDTEGVWHANVKEGIDSGIQYIAIEGDSLIVSTESDGTGTGYILNLEDGKVEETIESHAALETGNAGQAQQKSGLTVEYTGPDFVIKDANSHTIGQGSVATESNPYGEEGDYTISGHVAGNADSDPESEVLLIANHNQSYPGQVCVVEQSGKIITRYWNPGHVHVVKLYDINDDGKRELIFGATNQDQVWGNISTPAIYAFDLPAEEAEVEVPPFRGDSVEGDPEWVAFPDTEDRPLDHWYLSHLDKGDGLATLGIGIGVFSGVPALIVSALVLFKRRRPVFAMMAIITAAVIIVCMIGLTPLPE
ncbi:MAG: hypothetical protein R6U37_07980 [Dehalococcoidia bacterium]